MPLYFVVFLSMLGASALLFVGASICVGVRRRPLPVLITGRAADTLGLVHLARAWSTVGVCWVLYFNVYRIHVDMAALGDAALRAFSRGCTTRLPVVVPPFGAGALAATLGLWASPGRVPRGVPWDIATSWMLSVASTPWAAGAQGDMQDHGFSQAAFQQLQLSHLARTLCVSVAGVWALLPVARPRP